MPKIKEIAKDSDAGRVRGRMIDDLVKFWESLDSELQAYGHLFTGEEKRQLRNLARKIDGIQQLMDRNEEARTLILRGNAPWPE